MQMPFSRKLLIGIVGCGRVFERYHLPSLSKCNDWKLAAVCEPLKERREWIHRFYPDLPVFKSFERVLKNSSLEAVLITTPPATHAEISIRALDEGLHVMVEKPFALNLEDAKKMLESSKRNQRLLQIGFNRRFNCYYSELKKRLSLIPNDCIKSISSKLIINPNNWNAITSFYGNDLKGGGVIDDGASHQIDLVPWLLEDRVESLRTNPAASDGEPGFGHVKYELKFSKGLIAKCESGHGPKYAENLMIQLEDRKFLACPTGLLELYRLPMSLAHFFSRLRTFLHFSIHRFSGKSNVTLKSIEKQLSAFAAAIRGETDASLGADAGAVSIRYKSCRHAAKVFNPADPGQH
jgi:predicted dehydrogenase